MITYSIHILITCISTPSFPVFIQSRWKENDQILCAHDLPTMLAQVLYTNTATDIVDFSFQLCQYGSKRI